MTSSSDECDLGTQVSGISHCWDGIVLTDQKNRPGDRSMSGSRFQRRATSLPALRSEMKSLGKNALTDCMRGRISALEDNIQGLKNVSDDTNQTLAELGLTPDSLTNKDLIKLFSHFNKLTYYTHVDYTSDKVYKGQTIPNTMSLPVQTRHALWTSIRLLRQLDITLRKYTYVPPEYQLPFAACTQLLEDLSSPISQLEAYQYFVPVYSKGKLDSAETRQNLKSLAGALDRVIECVGKSQMNIRAIDWALNKCSTLAPATTGSINEEPEGHKSRECRNIV